MAQEKQKKEEPNNEELIKLLKDQVGIEFDQTTEKGQQETKEYLGNLRLFAKQCGMTFEVLFRTDEEWAERRQKMKEVYLKEKAAMEPSEEELKRIYMSF